MLSDRFTISNQVGINISWLFLSKDRGIGSSGEQLIPYSATIDLISSSIAVSNASNAKLQSAKIVSGLITVRNVFRIFIIFSLKYV